ncbi:MAG: hypothetical protein [Cressdnaviricota sp.]|nr:MAG: hypothetical protein [Cressdnaviricota sp.]
MTSYFEISGHIVECSTDDSTSLPSSISMVSVVERPERGRNSTMNENFSSRTSVRPRSRSDIHRETQRYVFDMWTIPLRNFRASDVIAPIGAGLRNFELAMERNREFYEYLSQ